MGLVRILDFFMHVLLMPVSFLVVFVVQLKIIRTLGDQSRLIMFYGKQIEEIRKMVAAPGYGRARPEVPPDDMGLYEVLNE